jgi:hypothetical protein
MALVAQSTHDWCPECVRLCRLRFVLDQAHRLVKLGYVFP